MDGKKRGGGTAKSKQVKSSEYTVQHSFPPLTLMTGCNVDCKLYCMNQAFCTISMITQLCVGVSFDVVGSINIIST